MTKCIVCKNEIIDGAKKCTHCDEYQNYRRYLKLPQNALALLIALISVTTVLVPILRNSNSPISEDKVSFSWLFASNTSMTLLLHNESDEDAFIQEIYFFNPKDSSKLYLDRFSRKPIIPKRSITPYEIPVFSRDIIEFKKNLEEIILWINWKTPENEHAYILTFCDNSNCEYGMDRLTPILESFEEVASNNTIITDLYFGKNTPSGSVSENEWKIFKDSIISKKFNGFTELNASGFWTNNDGIQLNENTSIIRIIHGNSGQELDDINHLVNLYKDKFEQESVLLIQTYDSQIEFK